MAISTYGTYLMVKDTGGQWEKLIDIKDFPDLIDSPNMLDTTTLSDPAETQIPGIKKASEKKFTANYTKADFKRLQAHEGKDEDIAIHLGDEAGKDGKFVGKGILSLGLTGQGVGDVHELPLVYAMTKAFEFSET